MQHTNDTCARPHSTRHTQKTRLWLSTSTSCNCSYQRAKSKSKRCNTHAAFATLPSLKQRTVRQIRKRASASMATGFTVKCSSVCTVDTVTQNKINYLIRKIFNSEYPKQENAERRKFELGWGVAGDLASTNFFLQIIFLLC